jgi:aerobic carbon-monoxide dehydrogenase large subunit
MSDSRWVGRAVRRVDAPRHLTGEAKFVADLRLPRMLDAAFLRSPEAHALIRSIDVSAAERIPGVVAAATADDLGTPAFTDMVDAEGLRRTPQPALARERVRFQGEPVAVVAAVNRYVAEDGVAAIRLELDSLPAVGDVEATTMPGAPLLCDGLPTNVVYRRAEAAGDVEAALAAAFRRVTLSLRFPRQTASPLEARGCVADYRPASGRLTLWCSTQMPHRMRARLARELGLPEGRIRVIAPDVGGAFGQKEPLYPEEVVTPLLAMRLGRPVRWVEDRRENFTSSSQARDQAVELEAGVDREGRLLAMRARCTGDAGAYSISSTSALIEPYMAATLVPGVYDVRSYAYEVVAALTNKAPVGPYRGVGWSVGQAARELLLDRVARELELDPAEVRRRNMVADEDLPYESCTGMVYDSGSFRASLELALDTAGYDDLRAEQERLRAEGRYLGIGLSSFVEPTGFAGELSRQAGFPVRSHDEATVRMDRSGHVTVAMGLPTQGQGIETTLAQVAADELGVPLEQVTVELGDTAAVPFGMGTFGSRAAVVGSGAVALAAGEVRLQLLRAAEELLEAALDDLVLEDGRVFVRGSPSPGVSVAEIAAEPVVLASTRAYEPGASYANGCVVAVVEVCPELGLVDVRDVVVVDDCGTAINPALVEGQIVGGVVQGVGSALLEALVYSEDGSLLTTTYTDYLLPTAGDAPRIEVRHLESPSPVTHGGVKGVGEAGLLAAPAAVAGAVADALAPFGASFDALPLTPDAVRLATAGGPTSR